MRDGGTSVLYRGVLIHNADRLRATEPDHIFGDHRELPPLPGLPDLATQEQPA